MADLWSSFCGCSDGSDKNCDSDLVFITNPSSCMNHILIICFDLLLLGMLLLNLFYKSPLKPGNRKSRLQLVSAVFNGLLGTLYSCVGFWTLKTTISTTHTVLPLHEWLLFLFHGLTWLAVSLTVSLWGKNFAKTPVQLMSIVAFLFAGIFGILSFIYSILNKRVSIKIALDALSFLGATLLLSCTYKGYKYEETDEKGLYTPLNGETKGIKEGYDDNLTPLAKAGFLNVMSFWWLNPLMKLGSEKTLQEKDMPKLCIEDRAESCYLTFLDQLNKQKHLHSSSQPSTLRTIVMCNLKELLISGFFALMKIITVSAGPLFLKSFIRVAEGNDSFSGEGYVLALGLFFSKILESLSQRQWDFRCRLIGIRVRSLLTAAIYKKQLNLSNAAKITHSAGEIMNYATVDAYRIGELPNWIHQSWTTILQLIFALAILFQAVGLATFASLGVIIFTVICNAPLAKLQHQFQSKLMIAQDERLKAISEALVNMKVLKLYAWEIHFKGVIEKLRTVEDKWLSAVQLRRAYNSFLFWSSPLLVSTATFGACYFIGIPLNASNVFTFVATLRLVQDPIRTIPDVIGFIIQAKVAFSRILNFLEAPELESAHVRQKVNKAGLDYNILIESASLSWEENLVKPTLRKINLRARLGEKIAICGEVGSGKSTLLAGILGEVPIIEGTLQVYGSIAYVSQSAWIQTGSIRDNILFGSAMDEQRYQETIEKCSLVKDLELLMYGDLTEIGERGVNLSGGQKQRIQLARALYQDADIYLLDDPFSAVDAHTASSLFNEFVMEALSRKTVLLVTHQVDFLPAFDSVLLDVFPQLMSDGEILAAAPYHQLMGSSREFQDLVNAHKETAGSERLAEVSSSTKWITSIKDVTNARTNKTSGASGDDQLIKKEEMEEGDTGLRPYIQYLSQNKGYLFFSIAALSHVIFVACNVCQNSWMAANVDNPEITTLKLIVVYLAIGVTAMVFLLSRSLFTVALGLQSSKSIFSQLLISLFRAPMSFYDSTPLGRVLSRVNVAEIISNVSVDLSIIDLDIPFNLIFALAATTNFYSNMGVLVFVTWQILFVSIPLRYYFSSAKMLMRINGTTKSLVANHLAESVAGAMTIRAFKQEDRFFLKNLDVVDINASPYLHSFAANNWLIQRLETISATVLSASGLCMVLLPPGTFSSGFIGMAMSYGLSLNMSLVMSIQNQCTLVNYIISVERVNQYMHLPSEAPIVIEKNRPPTNWPNVGKVDIQDLQIRYRPDTPLVLRGVTCTFQGGHKIGIVGRTGSGKTTLISALFRLVEPIGGKIVVDGIDISTVGLHDLRSRFGIIPQDPTLFNGTVRYNLDPLCQHTDQEIWEVLGKCQLKEAVQDKTGGLDSIVVEDGTNWSMGQRQLFCLGRALLRRSKILVLDEATASIDNATDTMLQETIRSEFADCTVITVAHRIPTVMDCTMVLTMSDGKIAEYDDPMKLMRSDDSLFGQLVKEYWSHS
ncbi:AAA+ ATPase domain-containing protein [Cynara cardunculus var. scolymus]|uniref:ABC-type xenobiotic transporter n=1 Tax=Cynara cardunculus var. scolymus TaxID=59895 RepID=A0A103YJB6_CYNCS|nr:AAA+ ATPase domain-containing protein [Cynara cardunculus var. scolymus]